MNRRLQKLSDKWYLLRNPNVTRIGDKRREEVQRKLDNAYVGGFISKDELSERTDIVLESRYEHELFWVLDDLPYIPEPKPLPVPHIDFKESKSVLTTDEVYWGKILLTLIAFGFIIAICVLAVA